MRDDEVLEHVMGVTGDGEDEVRHRPPPGRPSGHRVGGHHDRRRLGGRAGGVLVVGLAGEQLLPERASAFVEDDASTGTSSKTRSKIHAPYTAVSSDTSVIRGSSSAQSQFALRHQYGTNAAAASRHGTACTHPG